MSDLQTHQTLRFVQRDKFGLDTLIGRSRSVPNQGIVLTPCVELVLLGRASEPPTFLRQPYEHFLSRWRDRVAFWWDGGIQSRRPRGATLEKVATRLAAPETHRSFACNFHAGSGMEMLPPSFEVCSDAHERFDAALGQVPVHYDWHLAICLPPEYATRGAAWWKELLGETAPPSFGSGWVGLGIQWNSGLDTLDKNEDAILALRRWLLEYPGLTPGPNILLPAAREGIRTVGWFTLLGKELAARKGGIQTIRRALGSDEVSPLGEGVMIQAAESPRLGDSESGLPEYHAVGRYLADLRVDHGSLAFHESGFGGRLRARILDPGFDEWVARFD